MYKRISQKVFAVLHVVFVFTAIGLGHRAGYLILQKGAFKDLSEVDLIILAAILMINSVIAMEIGNEQNRKKESEVSQSKL